MKRGQYLSKQKYLKRITIKKESIKTEQMAGYDQRLCEGEFAVRELDLRKEQGSLDGDTGT